MLRRIIDFIKGLLGGSASSGTGSKDGALNGLGKRSGTSSDTPSKPRT